MKPPLLRYRNRELSTDDIEFVKNTIGIYYAKGRSYISRQLCDAWNWKQPNGERKEYAARDLLLYLEIKGFVQLPPRLNNKNNKKQESFDQVPLFDTTAVTGLYRKEMDMSIELLSRKDEYLWNYLLHHYHYLGKPRLVGEHIRYIAYVQGQVVGCIAWSSAAWRVKSRDSVIGWSDPQKRKNLHYIANNCRFLIVPWVRVKNLASKVLSETLKRLSDDWERKYHHSIYLAETFVDISRYQGTCYKASNWQHVGQTSGSSKRGNEYHYHGISKAVYVYGLHPQFRSILCDDPR